MEIVISEIAISTSGVDTHQFHLRQQLSGGEKHATQDYGTLLSSREREFLYLQMEERINL